MSTLTEGKHSLEFLISEAPGHRSRENITVASGQTVTHGSVLGRIRGAVTTTAFTAANHGQNNTGTGTFAATPTAGAGCKEGRYILQIYEVVSNAGRFMLFDPDGILVGVGNVAAAYAGPHLSFTLQDATDFAAGDGFYIDVAVGTTYGLVDPEGTNGTEIAVAILCTDVDTTANVAAAAIVRDAEVNKSELDFSDADSTEIAAIIRQLALQGIIVRTAY